MVSGSVDSASHIASPTLCLEKETKHPGGMASHCAVGESNNAAASVPTAESTGAVVSIGPKRVKRKTEQIDLDLNIKAARMAMKAAAKAVQQAKAKQRNEMRRKQRLMKKAAGLSSGDLERIAVMKRCGLFDPTTMMAVPRTDGVQTEQANTAASSSGEAPPPTHSNNTPGRTDIEMETTAQHSAAAKHQDHDVEGDHDLDDEDP